MFDKLSAAEVRYEELSKKLCDPDLINDNALYRDTMREYKNLSPLVEKYREYKSARAIEEESRAMLEEGISDKEFRELVESELDEAREKLSVISDELKEHYTRGGLGDMKCKKFLNEVLNKFLEPMRQRRHELEQDIPEICNILKKGTEQAREVGAQTMAEVRRAMRIDYFNDEAMWKL